MSNSSAASDAIKLVVVGAHLSGMPLNRELQALDAKFVTATRTAPTYKLYALAGTVPPKPGLIRVAEGGGQLDVEVWELSAAGFGAFVNAIPAPLGIGTLSLEDGSAIKGFLVEPIAIDGAEDITSFGGWRNYIAHRTAAAAVD